MRRRKGQVWKQGFSIALACALTATALPAITPLTAEAAEKELLKAGPINAMEGHVTQDQPFATGTGGSQKFRIPAFIVTQDVNPTGITTMTNFKRPGQGILTSTDDIVIPFYHNGITEENASIVWSSDNGGTWSRTDDVPGSSNGGWWSSESEVIELSDGTLRMFFRSNQGVICQADAKKDATTGKYVFDKPVKTGVSCTSTSNVTAIRYSKKVDGKEAILVAVPQGPGGRKNGIITMFLVNDDKTLTVKNIYSVSDSSRTYMYSCMSELPDGTVGLLWENLDGYIRYDNFDIGLLMGGGGLEGQNINVSLSNFLQYGQFFQNRRYGKSGRRRI